MQCCQRSKLKSEMKNNFERCTFPVNVTTEDFSISSMLNTLYAVPKRKGKVYSPSTIPTQAMASRILGCPPYQQISGGVCLHYVFLILSIGLGIPNTSLSRALTSEQTLISRVTHLAWKILTAPCRSMSGTGTQNRCSFE